MLVEQSGRFWSLLGYTKQSLDRFYDAELVLNQS